MPRYGARRGPFLTVRRFRHVIVAAASAVAGVAIAASVIGGQAQGSVPSNFGGNFGQLGINIGAPAQLLAEQTTTVQTSTAVSISDEKIFARYHAEWWSFDTGLEMNFTKGGVAYIKWGRKLPCGTSCTYQMTVTFTTSGHTSRYLRGTITWVNQATAKQGTFKVGLIVGLIGNPELGRVSFATDRADPALLFRQ